MAYVKDCVGHSHNFVFNGDEIPVDVLRLISSSNDCAVAHARSCFELHQDEILAAQPWVCSARGESCQNLATKFQAFLKFFRSCPDGSPKKRRNAIPDPKITSFAYTCMPICSSAECHDASIRGVQNEMKDERRDTRKWLSNVSITHRCEFCGAWSSTNRKFQACGRCRAVFYCDRTCQVFILFST